MATGSTHQGSGPVWWFEPSDTLPDGATVVRRLRAGSHAKVVALVGYHDDAEAGRLAKRLPYAAHGEGIEEIVFCRTGPPTGEEVQFDDDAWPGEDRTYVTDDLDDAVSLTLRFAVEYGADGSLVLATGDPDFLAGVAARAGLSP